MSLNQNQIINQTLQTQMITAITQQSALFQQMNGILLQLNTGFQALTQAIMQNTTTMAKLSIVGPKGTMFDLTQLWTGKGAGPSQGNLAQLDLINAAFEAMNEPIKNLIGSVQQLGTASQNASNQIDTSQNISTTKPKRQSKEQTTFENMTSSFKDINKIMLEPLKSIGSAFSPIKDLGKIIGSTLSGLYQGSNLQSKVVGAKTAVSNTFQKVSTGHENFKDNHQFLGGITSGIGQAISAPFKALPKAMSPFTSALSSMGPQFMAMALVMQPVMEFLTALLEPFSIITDYFSAYGSVLSQLFIPIMQSIQPLLDAVLQILINLVPQLTPFITQLFSLTSIGLLTQLLTLLMPIISSVVSLFGSLIQAITPILGIVTQLITAGFNLLAPAIQWVADVINGLVKIITDSLGGIQKIADDVFGGIINWFKSIWDIFTVGGGLDKDTSTWW